MKDGILTVSMPGKIGGCTRTGEINPAAGTIVHSRLSDIVNGFALVIHETQLVLISSILSTYFNTYLKGSVLKYCSADLKLIYLKIQF
jgi:hypothetical protein